MCNDPRHGRNDRMALVLSIVALVLAAFGAALSLAHAVALGW